MRPLRPLSGTAQGNAHFAAGRFVEAIECYTLAMNAAPRMAVLPANRAMALLKLRRYAEAEADCSAAIALDGGYTKAYLRRASARMELGRLADAVHGLLRLPLPWSAPGSFVAAIVLVDHSSYSVAPFLIDRCAGLHRSRAGPAPRTH